MDVCRIRAAQKCCAPVRPLVGYFQVLAREVLSPIIAISIPDSYKYSIWDTNNLVQQQPLLSHFPVIPMFLPLIQSVPWKFFIAEKAFFHH